MKLEQLFNTDPLLNDLNNVIQNGLNKLLNNYITNYKLYEETHNCIMNLPSVKREIAKKTELNETYNDLPDLISISSDGDTSSDTDTDTGYGNYNIIPTQDDSDQESDDTLLCMKKVANQLLKEKQEMIASYIEKEKSYKENYDKEIADLKDRINVLFEQSTRRYDLFYEQKTLYENTIEKYIKEIDDLKHQLNNCVKQEKENIILHIEEESDVEEDESEDEPECDEEQDDEAEEDEEEKLDDEEDEEAAEDEVAIEDEEASEAESDNEAEESEFIANDEIEESEVDELIEENEEAELSEDEVETEEEKDDEEEEKDDEEEEKDGEVEADEDAEEELIEIEIDGVTYCTENEDNGFIYELDSDGNVGETVGYLKDGEPFFN